MTIGFKTGPKNWEGEGRILAASGAKACEVWFNIGRKEEYGEMLRELSYHGIEIGLHHWGLVNEKYKTNLATGVEKVRAETIDQMKRTIDIGKEISCGYVNIHPGARFLEELEFFPWRQRLVKTSETPVEQSSELFLMAAAELQTYAEEREVLLTIETLPALEVQDGHGRRNHTYNPNSVPLAWLEEMGQAGGWLANDITHTAGQLALINGEVGYMWQELLSFTKRAAKRTRLLHINTVTPPFNGTDSHDGITEDDFARSAFPNKGQLQELLDIFADRDDVFVVPEPQDGKAVDNFQALAAMVSS